MASIVDRVKNSWNVFMGRETVRNYYEDYRFGSSSRPDIPMFTKGNARSVVTSVYNQIAVDCAQINLRHVRLDENDDLNEMIEDELDNVLHSDANVDQTGRMLIQDIIITLLDEGSAAVVPVKTSKDPELTDAYTVREARVGRIIQWYPQHVLVSVYDDRIGKRREIRVAKRYTPIIQNPFYATMNEPNATAKRLLRILNQLDRTNEHNSSDKMDLIIQLPYQIKNPAKRAAAELRRKDITDQLTGSKYGIAYIDATEKVIQLNRSLENNLYTQAKELQADLYNQLGFSEAIFNNTADEQTMLNYYNRTIEPLMNAVVEEIQRKWISVTGRTQKQAIRYFRDPFKLVPVMQLAEMSDKLTRNEIMTSNEIRSVIGLRKSDDPRADELINSNINQSDQDPRVTDEVVEEDMEIQNE